MSSCSYALFILASVVESASVSASENVVESTARDVGPFVVWPNESTSALRMDSLNVTAHGPFSVASENVVVGGYVCGGNQGAVVYYPTDHDKSPLISFAHGFTAGGESVAVDYNPLLKGVASWGYVIVALKSAPKNYCNRETEDQIHSLDWAKTSKFASRIDWDKPTGVMGHSMGATARRLADPCPQEAVSPRPPT